MIITKVVINPADPDILFAGAMGLPFAPTTARGVYRSSNGGVTWDLVHSIDEQTGIIDLVSHPANPTVIYAASWTRVRNNQESIISSENCRIWRSNDNGDNWEMLTDGLPDGELCRIGLTMSNSDPNKLYYALASPPATRSRASTAPATAVTAGALWTGTLTKCPTPWAASAGTLVRSTSTPRTTHKFRSWG